MEEESMVQSSRQHDEEFNIRGARNISKLEKLESERTQTTTSRSVTTNGHQRAAQYLNGDDSSPEILIEDDTERRRTSAIADESDEWRSTKAEQHSDMVEQRSATQMQRHGAEERRAAVGEQRSTKQSGSTRSLSRRERNVAAAELAYRTVGLPADTEYSQVSRRSKTVNTGARSKSGGGLSELEDTADMIVEDAMEHAIETLYGKKRRRKMAKTASRGETRSLDRHARTTTTDRTAISDFDTTLTENRARGRTINETTSRDESRKKAVSYLTVEKDDEEDIDLQRPASADGRLTNRVDYAARRRAQAAYRLPHASASRSRHQATYTSPPTSRYQRRTAANVLASQRLGGYSSETEVTQTSRRPDRRQHFSGDDSDFSTTVEIRNPRSTQFQTEHDGYTSDESDIRNLQSSSHSRVPTLTKGMVTKILHGDRPPPPTTEMFVSEVPRFDVQSAASPLQFSASSPTTVNVASSPTVYRDSHMSTIIPVRTTTTSRSAFRPSAVDDNFLLQRAPVYQPHVDAAQYFSRQIAVYGGGGTGRSTPASLQNDERLSSSYAAFSNEPIIVANLDDNYATNTTSMRRTHSLLALNEVRSASAVSGRSQTPLYSSRPDLCMTNRQVLNLYLFNRRPFGDDNREREPELETVTRTMTFDEEVQNKQTQTTSSPSVHRKTTHYVTRQRDVEKLTPPKTTQSSKCIQTDTEHIPPKPSKRRKLAQSRVTEETVITKPSITETRETEMVGDVFADRRRISSQESERPGVPITRSSVTHARREEPPQEEPEEEMLETTVVEEKEQRIEMTIREDLEFSLQRSRGTANAVTGSADEGTVEPWWIPDKFQAFVERKRQKVTQTKDIENKDDHSKRTDIERRAYESQDDASESNNIENNSYNYEPGFDNQNTTGGRKREADRNVRIPIFLEGRYNSPLHGMTSPSSNLVRTRMKTHHSEPELNGRHQYYLSKRDKYYGNLFDNSRHKPLITDNSNSENTLLVTSSDPNRRQRTSSVHVPEVRLEVVNDEASGESDSATAEPRFAEKRYVTSYSQYISPPITSDGSTASVTGTRVSHQPMTPETGTVFPTSKIISLPNVEPDVDCGTDGPDDDHLPDSLDHFDRVLTEIEEELPAPPPLPPPLPPGNQRTQNNSSRASLASQQHLINSSTTPSVHTPPTRKKSKPPPPEKSWKRNAPLPPKSGKLYSSQVHPTDSTTSGIETQKSTATRSKGQYTNVKTADKEETPPTSSAAAGRQQATGTSDFRRELGDSTYVRLSLTEPVQSDEQHRRIAVMTQRQHAEPGGFAYGWASQEQKKEHSPQPGSYQLRHSRWASDNYETAATAF